MISNKKELNYLNWISVDIICIYPSPGISASIVAHWCCRGGEAQLTWCQPIITSLFLCSPHKLVDPRSERSQLIMIITNLQNFKLLITKLLYFNKFLIVNHLKTSRTSIFLALKTSRTSFFTALKTSRIPFFLVLKTLYTYFLRGSLHPLQHIGVAEGVKHN